MKSMLLLILVILVAISSCTRQGDQNPFFSEYKTPFETAPLCNIREEHYMPAFKEGMRRHREEIKAIITNPEPATFANTIEVLEYSGDRLDKVAKVFYNLNSAHTNDQMQAIAREVAPLLSKHNDDISLNDTLFQRVKAVYEQKDKLSLNVEQKTLLDKYFKDFIRSGANLSPKKKTRMREINEELSVLSLKFGENILKENNAFELVIESEDGLDGLPGNVVASGVEAGKEKGHEGKWVYTLHKSSMIPFLQYSEKRQLREKIFTAYVNRGNNNDEYDNKAIAAKIAALRAERVQLLGFPTHAHFILDKNMAKVPENVYELLDKLWTPALKRAKAEARELQKMINREGNDFALEPWDWWYYAEKLKKEKYDLDDEILRPYFQLKNVRQGAFDLATKLWGITFTERKDIPIYHEDVKVFEVKEADGSHIGIFYTDYFVRASKRGGAWMNNYRDQYVENGENVTPIVTNVCNFSKPAGEKPSLLSLDQVTTLFHEFGHGLHGLLSKCTYPSVSGTEVARDFVELPSQIMENWALEPEVLKTYARHYETGETIPDELIEKIKKSELFNQGFKTVEYLAASYLDMDWHTLTTTREQDILEFEDYSMNRINLIPEIIVRYRTPYFSHIFAGGYSSGYYSYIWAEVLDADAFQAFKETDLFDKKTAKAFRDNVLSRGGTEEPMVLYKRFRGAEPNIDALLERRGLK